MKSNRSGLGFKKLVTRSLFILCGLSLAFVGCSKKSSDSDDGEDPVPEVVAPATEIVQPASATPTSTGAVSTVIPLQPEITSLTYSDKALFTYDNTWIRIGFGSASLLARDRTDDSGDTAKGFGGGTHNDTTWDSTNEYLGLSASGLVAGSGLFTSRVMSTVGNSQWDTLAWSPLRPYGKPLPDNKIKEKNYPQGNFNTSGNFLLYHMDLSTWTGSVFEIIDSSGSGNYGTSQNGLTTTSEDCVFGNCASFDGINQYIFLDDPGSNTNPTFDDEVSKRSGSFWFNASLNTPSTPRVLYEEGGTVNGINVYQYEGNICIGAWSSSSGWAGEWLCSPITTGTWQHVAFSFDGLTDKKLKLYVNGAFVSEAVATTTVSAHSGNNSIGAMIQDTKFRSDHGDTESGNGYYFAGKMDEIAFFDRVLAASEVSDIFKRGAFRLRFKVRTCPDVSCSGIAFTGPSNSSNTFFSELNNLSHDSTPVFNFSRADAPYFQYQVQMISLVTTDGPKLTAVEIGPGRYFAGSPGIVNKQGIVYEKFEDYSRIAINKTDASTGSVKLQLSPDGTEFYFYSDGSWKVVTSATVGNTAEEASAGLKSFSDQFGPGSLFVKSLLVSDGEQKVALKDVSLQLYWKKSP